MRKYFLYNLNNVYGQHLHGTTFSVLDQFVFKKSNIKRFCDLSNQHFFPGTLMTKERWGTSTCSSITEYGLINRRIIAAAHWLTLKGKGKGIGWKVRSNFVIRPRPALLCVLQYQSDMAQDHQRASALICWRLGVCGDQRLTFHLAQNLGFTLASVIRWLTIITPWENGGRGGRGWERLAWEGRIRQAAAVLSVLLAGLQIRILSAFHPNMTVCVTPLLFNATRTWLAGRCHPPVMKASTTTLQNFSDIKNENFATSIQAQRSYYSSLRASKIFYRYLDFLHFLCVQDMPSWC